MVQYECFVYWSHKGATPSSIPYYHYHAHTIATMHQHSIEPTHFSFFKLCSALLCTSTIISSFDTRLSSQLKSDLCFLGLRCHFEVCILVYQYRMRQCVRQCQSAHHFAVLSFRQSFPSLELLCTCNSTSSLIK